ncbi:MAG: trypsin-like peptidase domain-containing protein [Oscillospiraceae bacterium]|nr:trypsin-like peptidase domain-containing protein [Oscillospiraceae bacterium]
MVLLVCLALVAGLVGGVLAGNLSGGDLNMGPTNTTDLYEGQREEVKININQIDTSKLMTPAEVYAANVNSTVGITTSITTNLWGHQTTSAASGSGFIISADGYILTNYHVIEGSSSVTVSFFDGTSKSASIVGYEANNDIAILKVEAENLVPVIMGDSDKMNVGDSVIAIGNPLGELTFTLTSGIVSALDRDVTTSSGIQMTLIQTDCAINSGNSGGALFNLYGEVIGITNAKYSSSSNAEASIDNIGFAIPMNQVRKIVEGVLKNGYYSKPYIGVSVTDVSEETQSYGLPQGAAVKTVVEGSPAAMAGLQINDIITLVNDTEITGSNDLVKFVGKANVGDVLKLKVYRMGAYLDLELTVGEQKQAGTQQQQQQEQQSNMPGYFNPFG